MKTILIVDDNIDLAHTLALWLAAPGREVLTAHDGHSGLSLAFNHLPQVIILDIGLPGKDGHQVTAELRRRSVTKLSLIVAVSGYGLPERRRALQAGADHFFAKPADPHRLATLVSDHLQPLPRLDVPSLEPSRAH